MARVFLAKAIRVRRAHRAYPTAAEYGAPGEWEDLEPGVTTVPVAWFADAGHNLGANYEGLPVETAADAAWTGWDIDQIIPDFDATGMAATAATDVPHADGSTAMFFVLAPGTTNPAGTFDLGDPADPASMRSTTVTNPQVNQLRDITGRQVPRGVSRMDVAKYAVREVGWSAVADGTPFEVDTDA